MRLPGDQGPFEFEGAGETEQYVMNSWLYDLSLTFRPFVTRDVSRWLSSVYFFAGGGGADGGPGRRGPAAVRGHRLRAGRMPFVRAGARLPSRRAPRARGWTSFPWSALTLFGEAGAHVYDSPVHVDDEWVGPLRLTQGSTARIADDATAVTGRLVLGLKAMFGNQLEMPVAPPPPPPPEVTPQPIAPPPPPPPVNPMREIRVCVVENGMLRQVTAMYNTQNGDTTVNGPAVPGHHGLRRWSPRGTSTTSRSR